MIGRPGPGADKGEWRGWARSEWGKLDPRSISPPVVESLARSPLLRGATTLMLYFPMSAEIDLTPLMDLVPASTLVTATRTPPSGPLSLHRVEEAELEEHFYGFRQPTAGATPIDPVSIDVALVPGLCFARDGTRLGHGAGYFDEFLARGRPDAVRIGVVPQQLLVGRLPSSSHDVAMTHLATEAGVRPVG
ncbi:MAG: 5-formyltetrahydrofolate cyclo-ligase [Acidimicrobiia bacterium]